jgi:hypothetical protein
VTIAVVAVVLSACKPNLNETVSIVTQPTVLAVRADPAEAAPKDSVKYTALYVGPSGPIPSAPIQWAFCNARKPLAELGPVNPECLLASGSWFAALGSGAEVSGAVPDIACRQFGPEVPESVMGQPPGRPVDPDLTGGYYQPVRLFASSGLADAVSIEETRLSCGLAGATSDVTSQFQERYHVNTNPAVASLEVIGSIPLAPDDHGAKNPVKAGTSLPLRVAWVACPRVDRCGDGVCGPDEVATMPAAPLAGVTICAGDCMKPAGCTGAERYVVFDLASQSLVARREAITVSWFASGGAFDFDSTGRESSDPAASSDNVWHAPAQPALVHVWVILRDERGGVGWAEYQLDVH